MGGVFSRATYAPNPNKSTKGGCCSCACAPFRKGGNKNAPTDLPKPPEFVLGEVADADKDSRILNVQSADLQVKSNALEHHTNDFHLVEKENPCLVIRRGQPFVIKIVFNRPYKPEEDVVCFVFTSKDTKTPNYAQGTLISVPLFDDVNNNPSEWSAKLVSTDDNTLTASITTPPNGIVGAWGLDIDTKLQNGTDQVIRYSNSSPIYVLFNPWCKNDTVYLDDEDKLKEYVSADSGLIWRGGHTRLRPTPWSYAQFEENVLECCVYLLNHVGILRKTAHGDPVLVARHLSAVINSPDDNGVLVGRWDGDYKGGEPPTKWAGSLTILQNFYKSQKSVKYGQCWVFSGVLTTACRALGIPCRPVTNFSSAHDTQQSLTVDYFCDDNGELLGELSKDSVWNFHVWNEVWMQRPDLEPGNYGGWQAIDSTPQEASQGVYCCGPASVAAIKRGEIKKTYDGEFLFAEVNADKVYWRYKGSTQPLKLITKIQDAIGLNISTKAVGKFEREDITDEYKYPEKSQEERDTMLAALRQSRSMFSRYYLNDDFEDVKFDFQLNDDIVIGNSFKVRLLLKNKSKVKDYTISATLRVDTMLYTGKIKESVKKENFEVHLKSGREEEFSLQVTYDDYVKKLIDQCSFNIAALASVKETDFEYFAQDDFRIRMPDIKIEVSEGDLIQGSEFTVNASLKNPLPRSIRKGEFTFEGPGLGTPIKVKLAADVETDGIAIATCKMTPKLSGEKSIVAKFNSKELRDVDGYITVFIAPKTRELNGVGNSTSSTGPAVVNEIITAA